MQAMGLVTVDGWARFDDAGAYLAPYGFVPMRVETGSFFDSVKKWVGNVAKKAKAIGKKIQGGANLLLNNAVVDQAKAWISSVPGYGSAIAAALGAAQSLAKGKNWKDVALDAAQSAVPAGLGKNMFGAARGLLASATKGGLKNIVAPLKKAGARLLVDKLAATPAFQQLGTRALAQTAGVSDDEAQLAQASIYRQLAPDAPAYPVGVSLDDGAAMLGLSGADYDTLRGIIEPVRALTPAAEMALVTLVPALRDADERLRRLIVLGSLVGPGSNGGDAAGIEGNKYRVEPGDYGVKICSKLGHPGEITKLIAANPGIEIDRLQVGQLLHLPPGWGGTPTPAPAPPISDPGPAPTGIPPWLDPDSPSYDPSRDTRMPVPGPTAPPRARLYTVVAGDTYVRIAARHGLGPGAVPELIAANPGVDADLIFPGQTLAIPPTWPALGGGSPPTPAPAPPAPSPAPRVPPVDPRTVPQTPEPSRELPVPPLPPPPIVLPPKGDGPLDLPSPVPLPLPDPTGAWTPTAAHFARAQAILAAWTARFPSAASPNDFGRQQGDLSAVWTERSVLVCRSFQSWSNQQGSALRQDGQLDKPTFTALENTLVDLLGSVPVPAPAPAPSPLPGPPSPAPSSRSGGGLGVLLPIALSVLF